MALYRVTTPDTPRARGRDYADFARGKDATSPVCVRHLLAQHAFIGCTVHRKRREGWVLEFDSSLSTDCIASAAHWRRVENAQ